jgi:hypothetical protein
LSIALFAGAAQAKAHARKRKAHCLLYWLTYYCGEPVDSVPAVASCTRNRTLFLHIIN